MSKKTYFDSSDFEVLVPETTDDVRESSTDDDSGVQLLTWLQNMIKALSLRLTPI